MTKKVFSAQQIVLACHRGIVYNAPRNSGALAQLVERLHRTQQVRSSNLLCSMQKTPAPNGAGVFCMEHTEPETRLCRVKPKV